MKKDEVMRLVEEMHDVMISEKSELIDSLRKREERIRADKAEINILLNRAIELDRYFHEWELKLAKETKEAKAKLRFWRECGIVIGMMVTNVIWFISKVIFS